MISLNMKMPKNCNECPFHGLFYCNLYKAIKGELLDVSYELREEMRSHKCLLIDKKTGRWIDEGRYAEEHSEHAYRCSECEEHYIGYVGEYKFCPNCGARMESEVEE